MVDRPLVVVGPPGRVTEALVADHLQVGVDQNQVRMSLFDAIRLHQTVPRPDVVFKRFHRLLHSPHRQRQDVGLLSDPVQLTLLFVTLITIVRYC